MLLKQIVDIRKVLITLVVLAVPPLPALAFYGGSVWVLTDAGFTLKEIVRDPAQQTGLSSFLGFVSNIGVWLWVCVGGHLLFRSDQRQR